MARLASLLMLLALVAPIRAADPPAVSFERDVLPILNAHCLQCHGGVHQKNGLDLRTHEAAMKGGKSGAVVVPCKPDESLLWKKVNADEMPKTDNKVSAANKTIIKRWIEGGAKASAKTETAMLKAKRTPGVVAKRIDAFIDAKLQVAKVPASARSDDGEFLRRVYLDIVGVVPTANQAEAFLTSTDPKKREKLIDELLAAPGFGRNFAERWVNLFSLTTVSQRPPDPQPLKDWLAKGLTEGKSWSALVKEQITAIGTLEEAPAGQLFYYNADMNGKFEPKIIAGNFAQVMMGVQLQCAECHDHPFSKWKQTDFWGVAAFFGTMNRNETVENKNTPGVKERQFQPGKNGKPPDVPKEIAISIPKDGEARNGGKKILAAVPEGVLPKLDPALSHRSPFADWLTAKDNPFFARAAANRFWAHFFGRGFVMPLNDFHDGNPPSHPELLDELASEFAASDFDLKHLIRCVCTSAAYQRSCRVSPGNEKDETLFARMAAKSLTPEQLYDSLCVVLEVPDLKPPIDPKNPPKKPNPKAPPPPSERSVFVAAFRGPGEGDEPTELKLGVPHALKLMNGGPFNTGGKLVERLLSEEKKPAEVIEGIFTAILARRPTASEAKTFAEFAAKQTTPADGYKRVVWVLLNSSEFMLTQ